MIVTGDHEHAAMGRRTVSIAVLECIARTIDAGALAVPKREYAFDFARRLGLDLLGTEDCGRRKVLVHCRHEGDAEVLAQLLAAPQFLIDAAERRTAIAANEAC